MGVETSIERDVASAVEWARLALDQGSGPQVPLSCLLDPG